MARINDIVALFKRAGYEVEATALPNGKVSLRIAPERALEMARRLIERSVGRSLAIEIDVPGLDDSPIQTPVVAGVPARPLDLDLPSFDSPALPDRVGLRAPPSTGPEFLNQIAQIGRTTPKTLPEPLRRFPQADFSFSIPPNPDLVFTIPNSARAAVGFEALAEATPQRDPLATLDAFDNIDGARPFGLPIRKRRLEDMPDELAHALAVARGHPFVESCYEQWSDSGRLTSRQRDALANFRSFGR